LFDEPAKELFDTTDERAERVRKLGGTTIRSISEIQRLQRIKDNNPEYIVPGDLLRELMNDNKAAMTARREAHRIADEHHDIGTASMLETFIDGAEKRNWFLFEASRITANLSPWPPRVGAVNSTTRFGSAFSSH
jgi:starvation-inducible DNA-binding protein